MVLYAATTNAGKLRDFAAAARVEGVGVLPLPGIADIPEPIEDQPTFEGNAALKAIYYSRQAPGLLVMADDSGLEVEALNLAPGVRSARYAEDLGHAAHSNSTRDERNNALLLSHMASTSFESRAARFVCVLALARDGEILLTADGQVHGTILTAPRGEGGFGYDPLFYLPELNKSMAEMDAAEKWEYSHRGRAFRALLPQLGPLRP